MEKIMATLRTPKGCLGCLGLVLVIVALFVGGLMLGGIANEAYQLPEISLAAEEIPLPFNVPLLGHSVPNTLPATWLTMLLLIVISFFATRNMKLVPSGLQNAVEAIVEMFYGFIEGVAGAHLAPVFFPLVATFFFFILLSNWMGIFPGFGSVGVWAEHHGETVLVPFFRSANAHLSTTIALATISVGATQYFGFKLLGRSFLGRYFTFKSASAKKEKPAASGFAALIGKMAIFMERVSNAFVGILELISEFIKIMSFSFRLFGNIFAGEVLLIVVSYLAAFLASLPFMGLELFVGFVQALIFSMLSLVFFMMATAHHD
ncbi:MAG TPA: F0F1 ATP synthase subunit A [Anaerolineae bacterium]|nr:F0F1 ATP synthase subunit A [Anaerolineae bacterium]